MVKQELIPVGCVPPALYHTGGVSVHGESLSRGSLCLGESLSEGVSVQGYLSENRFIKLLHGDEERTDSNFMY